jgi:hypothetical protein
VNYLIIEDEVAPMERWLCALKESDSVHADAKQDACRALKLPLNTLVDCCDASFENDPPSVDEWPQLLPPFDYIKEEWEGHSRMLGVKGKNLILVIVKNEQSAPLIATWLKAALPSRCLSFLDYRLALNPEAQIAETLVQEVAVGPSQLCVNHSSVIEDIEGTRPSLGLTKAKQPFYRAEGKRLSTIVAARKCVQSAHSFWEKYNSVLTGVEEVDRIIGYFVVAVADCWDGAPFSHNSLQPDKSSSDPLAYQFLTGQGFLPKGADKWDDLKGLFMCRQVGSTIERESETGKKVSKAALVVALEKLGIEADLSGIDEEWAPPFTPGILVLCQLRLMMKAFSDNKDDRVPPTVRILSNSAEFVFACSIEQVMEDWEHKSSNSFQEMQAMANASVGDHAAAWKTCKSATKIAGLLNGQEGVITVKPTGDRVVVSWTI